MLQVEDWARILEDWARTYGVADSVMLLDELSSGDDVRGTGILCSSTMASRALQCACAAAPLSQQNLPCRVARCSQGGAVTRVQNAGGPGEGQVSMALSCVGMQSWV